MFGPLRRLQEKHAHARFLRLVLAAVLLRDNVVDMKREVACGFWEETVFAAPGCAVTNFEFERAA
jgi:hypothetical protein